MRDVNDIGKTLLSSVFLLGHIVCNWAIRKDGRSYRIDTWSEAADG